MKKRIIALVLLITTLAVLTACNNTNSTPDPTPNPDPPAPHTLTFNSIRYTETNTILSLGDPKETFDTAFGRAITLDPFTENQRRYSYLGASLMVSFEDGKAVDMVIATAETRLELETNFRYLSPFEIMQHFTQSDFIPNIYFQYFDTAGNTMQERADAAYAIALIHGEDAPTIIGVHLTTPNSAIFPF